jgi:glycosyltransferase involved in cell wall biosynthesis
LHIVYITVRTPFGPGESFIIPEANELLRSGIDLKIFPILPRKKIWHTSLAHFEKHNFLLRLFSIKVPLLALQCILFKPSRVIRTILCVLTASKNFRILLKNLSIIPRSLAAAHLFEAAGVRHIHAHWGSRTSTLALLVSEISGIPWSFTVHRWDIYENNILRKKIESARFVRCISQKGKEDLIRIAGGTRAVADKVRVIHMGIDLPEGQGVVDAPAHDRFRIAVPANMLPVKGHRYLIEAISLLQVKNGFRISCSFFGDGPLEESLRNQVSSLGLDNAITFCGRVAHALLLDAYRHGEFDSVILPSINTDDGQHEGIPVCLIEAMAHGLPVISTRTGSISELVDEETGILVPERDSKALAEAISRVAAGGERIRSMTSAACQKVQVEYEISSVAKKLIESFSL